MNRLFNVNHFLNHESWSTIIFVLTMLLLVGGCTSGNTTRGDAKTKDVSSYRNEIISFKIADRAGWRVRVSQDGSGSIAEGRRNTTQLPPGALDFDKWRDGVVGLTWYNAKTWREPRHRDAPRVVIGVWRSDGTYEAYYLDPAEVPMELFQAAVDATTDERIHNSWSKWPFK